jgi:hypothetical protein
VGADGWRELSYLVIGATREQAHALAYAYGQNAFVFVDASGLPQLVVVAMGSDVMELVVQPNGHIVVAGYGPPPPVAPLEELEMIPGDALRAAFEVLCGEPVEELNAVGVLPIEGGSPMNDARYAMLEVRPAVAKLNAASRGLPYRFRVDWGLVAFSACARWTT